MKSFILYSSLIPKSDDLQMVFSPDGTPIFIRVEVFPGDVVKALSAAKPREGEIVLNTIPGETHEHPLIACNTQGRDFSIEDIS